MRGYAQSQFLFWSIIASETMNVLALTIFISSCLAGIFVACFVMEIRRSKSSSPERDSLLPLDLTSVEAEPARMVLTPTHLPSPLITPHDI
jgi:hypothetical protein